MSLAVAVHIAIGSVALTTYWVALAGKKGARLHRLAGKVCVSLLVVTGLSVGPVLLTRPGPFDPAYAVKMLYLTTCLATVSALAFASIRLKADPERFRGRLFRLMGPVLLALGLVVLAGGLRGPDPVAVVLSWVGLFYGASMISFARARGPLHPRWWLAFHLDAACGLFNAVNGTFLYVVARWTGLVPSGPFTQTAFQLGTIAVALALRLFFGARHRAPIRLSAPTPAAAHRSSVV